MTVFEMLVVLAVAIPVALPVLWILGALTYYFRIERRTRGPLPAWASPPLSVLVPCHNEEATIRRAVASLDRLDYPDFEIVAIDDGSRDATLAVLEELAAERPRMRVVHLAENRGKAAALNAGLRASRHELVLCIDADSEPDPLAAAWMARHLVEDPGVAAVTGNPRVKNRGTLLGRIQVVEFTAIIGMIKRWQQVVGKLFALSGVLVLFRRRALLDVGLWDTDTVTEDIAVSWKLQARGWNLRYEPHALCDVLMPDTLRGLWRQRLRWAQGGFEVMSRHAGILLRPGHARLKVLYLEYVLAVLWTFLSPALLLAILLAERPDGEPLFYLLSWGLFLTGVISLLQFLAGALIHGRYEKDRGGVGCWSIWYPSVYWALNTLALMVDVPKALLGKRRRFSTWISPDRGAITDGK